MDVSCMLHSIPNLKIRWFHHLRVYFAYKGEILMLVVHAFDKVAQSMCNYCDLSIMVLTCLLLLQPLHSCSHTGGRMVGKDTVS